MEPQESGDALYRRHSAHYYDAHSTGLAGDAAFYLQEAQKAGSPVLELGCGTGRILFPIAESGVEIVGLDHSSDMLAIAEQKLTALPDTTQQRTKLVQGDMRDFTLNQRFSLVMIPYRAFGHLLTPEDQRKALLCIREHLAEDGKLIFNTFDPNLNIIAGHSGTLGSSLHKQGESSPLPNGNELFVWATRWYDTAEQVVHEDRIFEEVDAQGKSVARNFANLTLRYTFRYEMQHLLELCGFTVEALYGDFQYGPFRSGVEQVWVARG